MPGRHAAIDLESSLATIVQAYDRRSDTGAVQFALASPSRDWRWHWASPGSQQPYFIASITKLYVVALIMQLQDEGSGRPRGAR
ncbi:MAG: hypothetical protein HC809_03185 [Gammaproteobacteria bacterium]|nr:hypothetical protein [Gammaproteobacteria bacterium]